MLIKGTSISVKYKRIDGLKRVYYNNEEILKQYFNEATVLPVPDNAPADIPRIIVKTLHEHAQLNITPVSSTLQITYDEGFERDWQACARYIQERMKPVFAFLNILTTNKYDYIGIVTNVLLDDIKTDGAKVLANNLLKTQNSSRIYDLDVKYTFIEDENIFVNILLQNARLFNEGASADIAGALGLKNQIAESVGVVIDINDRYGFNSLEEYQTESSKLDCLLGKMTEVIDNKLNSLMEQGEY